MRTIMRSVGAFAAASLVAVAPAFARLDEKAWTQAKKDLEQALAGTDEAATLRAVEAVAADGTRRAAELLAAVGTSDRLDSLKVYEAALAGLRAMAGGEARSWLMETLERRTDAKSWPLRALLCEVLADVGGSDVTRVLAGRLKDPASYVVSAAARALGNRKDPEGVEPLIRALADLEKRKDVTWIDVRAALTAICGFDFETAKEWESFWASRREGFDPAKDRGEKAEPTTVVRDEARFFTEAIISKRVMFVIDVSGSMREQDIPVEDEAGGGGTTTRGGPTHMEARLEVVKKALIACVRALKPDVRFNIIAFSDENRSWRPARQGLQPADEAAKQDAVKWIEALEANGATETDKALKECFENIDVNTIVLLSDGQPTRGRGPGGPGGPGGRRGPGGGRRGGGGGGEIDPQEILDKVKVWNRLRGVKIHTFCFKVFDDMVGGGGGRGGFGFDPQKCLEFLRQLAEQNGGKLTKV
jgi:hypothetical protein